MTARVVISCDGAWHGMPCRGAYPTRQRGEGSALVEAEASGWARRHGRDLCPAHARQETTP